MRPKHFILTIASGDFGVGLGTELLMKRDVAGPVPFLMSVTDFKNQFGAESGAIAHEVWFEK